MPTCIARKLVYQQATTRHVDVVIADKMPRHSTSWPSTDTRTTSLTTTGNRLLQ